MAREPSPILRIVHGHLKISDHGLLEILDPSPPAPESDAPSCLPCKSLLCLFLMRLSF